MKPEFTSEELVFIEKVMDNQASEIIDLMAYITTQINSKILQDHPDILDLVCKQAIELGRTDAILKSIRDKCEKARK